MLMVPPGLSSVRLMCFLLCGVQVCVENVRVPSGLSFFFSRSLSSRRRRRSISPFFLHFRAYQIAPLDEHGGPLLVADDFQHRARGPGVPPGGHRDGVAAEDLPLGPLEHRLDEPGLAAGHRREISCCLSAFAGENRQAVPQMCRTEKKERARGTGQRETERERLAFFTR